MTEETKIINATATCPDPYCGFTWSPNHLEWLSFVCPTFEGGCGEVVSQQDWRIEQ